MKPTPFYIVRWETPAETVVVGSLAEVRRLLGSETSDGELVRVVRVTASEDITHKVRPEAA